MLATFHVIFVFILRCLLVGSQRYKFEDQNNQINNAQIGVLRNDEKTTILQIIKGNCLLIVSWHEKKPFQIDDEPSTLFTVGDKKVSTLVGLCGIPADCQEVKRLVIAMNEEYFSTNNIHPSANIIALNLKSITTNRNLVFHSLLAPISKYPNRMTIPNRFFSYTVDAALNIRKCSSISIGYNSDEINEWLNNHMSHYPSRQTTSVNYSSFLHTLHVLLQSIKQYSLIPSNLWILLLCPNVMSSLIDTDFYSESHTGNLENRSALTLTQVRKKLDEIDLMGCFDTAWNCMKKFVGIEQLKANYTIETASIHSNLGIWHEVIGPVIVDTSSFENVEAESIYPCTRWKDEEVLSVESNIRPYDNNNKSKNDNVGENGLWSWFTRRKIGYLSPQVLHLRKLYHAT